MRAVVEAPLAAPTSAAATSAPTPDTSERHAAARDTYRGSRQTGQPLTGAELARQYGMSERWGRNRIAEVKTTDGDHKRTGRPHIPRPNGTPTTGTTNANGTADRNGTQPVTATTSGTATNGSGTPASGTTSRNGNDTASVPATTNNTTSRNGNGTPTSGNGNGSRNGTPPVPATASGTAGVPDRSWLDLAIILLVAAVAAVASYGHMLHVALVAGEPLLIARAFPITVDGLVLAALRCGERGRHWLMLGIGVSVAANVLAQFPEVAADIGPVISAWPPLALYGTHRLVKSRRTEHPASEVAD